MYTDVDRESDFKFFIDNLTDLYSQYGNCFLAIRNGEVIEKANTIKDLLPLLNGKYPHGEYIIQECRNDESAYKTSIMRLMIHA